MSTRTRRAVRYGFPALVLAVAAAAAIALAARAGGDVAAHSPGAGAAAVPGSPQRFAVLSRASSNQCGLRSSSLSKMARGGRLQGSCCSRMDLHRYEEQVAGLRRYAGDPEIPGDPYDVSVALAQRLISYDESIELSDAQQATYDQAMTLSEEGGPCCCRCWRWTAFGGQAKYLITRRGWGAKQIAELWELEDGCGGSGHVGEHHTG
jgi:hypothetical protein